MEGSGSNSKQITCRKDGQEIRVWMVASKDVVEIGGWEFKRSDLLFAMGVKDPKEQAKEVEGLRAVIVERNRQRAELERKVNKLRSQVAQ